jgi:hypothetical protein
MKEKRETQGHRRVKKWDDVNQTTRLINLFTSTLFFNYGAYPVFRHSQFCEIRVGPVVN